jgi:thiol-disulfide isomerase/thioredoxin
MISKFQSTLRAAGAFAWLVCIGAFLAGAASAEDLGPPVGLKAPDLGTRPDQTGKPRTLPDLMGKNGLVLMFFRSADWCPYCIILDRNGVIKAKLYEESYKVRPPVAAVISKLDEMGKGS